MKQTDEFYIGWQDKSPSTYIQKSKRFFYVLLFLVPIIGVTLVSTQKGFEDATFEFGNITTVEGILVTQPVPMLKVKDENSKSVKSILLVGFGKKGALETIAAIEESIGEDIEGRGVKLSGTRIYHDGKELLELTDGTNAFIEKSNVTMNNIDQRENLGDVTLRGEIYDPKCAFGVMKPGYGKPHRSCAVRCISGGIPPVLKITNAKGESNYCLLAGLDGQAINEDVLEYVADQIQVCGKLQQRDDWLILYTNPREDILRLQPHFIEGEIPLCANLN